MSQISSLGSTLYNAQQTAAPTEDDLFHIGYATNPGILVLPIAGNPATWPAGKPTVKIVQVCLPFTTKTARNHKRRNGVKPILPTPYTSNPNEVLLGEAHGSVVPNADASGQVAIYQQEADYSYALLTPRTAATGMPTGKLPFLTIQCANTSMDASQFQPLQCGDGPLASQNQPQG